MYVTHPKMRQLARLLTGTILIDKRRTKFTKNGKLMSQVNSKGKA